MAKQKGKFLTFCCALVPGAGHMYLGFMKMGLSLMSIFAVVCALAVGLEIGALLLFAPIVWFYSFFDVINKNSLDPAEFYALEDGYIWGEDFLNMVERIPKGNRRKALSIVLIVVAACLVWSCMRGLFYYLERIHWIVGFLFNRIPVFAIAALIVWAAVRLLQNGGGDGGEDDGIFSDERSSDIPYPIVHPPVVSEEKPGEELKVDLDKSFAPEEK